MPLDPHLFWSAELNPHTPALDVHGFSVSAALHEVDFFIDRSVVQSHEVVKIIHGAGTGALRIAIRAALSIDKRVSGTHDSERPGEGGAVLYVSLR